MNITLAAHLPGVRIGQEIVPLGTGHLWRMPFDLYEALRLGSFLPARDDYERTMPVVLCLPVSTRDATTSWEGVSTAGTIEVKAAMDDWDRIVRDLRFGLLADFVRDTVEPFWQALLVAAPGSGVASPRSSLCLLYPEDGPLLLGRDAIRAFAVRGDTDAEYFFSPEFTTAELGLDVIKTADRVRRDLAEVNDADLDSAVGALSRLSAPELSPSDVVSLAGMTLEALLLPEARTDLTRTFARRVANLVGRNDADRSELVRQAKRLYDARSAVMHGSSRSAATGTAQSQQAVQLLATAIVRLLGPVQAGRSVASLRAGLDAAPTVSKPATVLVDPGYHFAGPSRHLREQETLSVTWALPSGGAPRERGFGQLRSAVARLRGPATSAATADIFRPPEGRQLRWAPLAGLAGGVSYASGTSPEIVLGPASGAQLWYLEDKSTRTDMTEPLRYEDTRKVTLLGVSSPHGETVAADRAVHRAVVALRLSRCWAFADPVHFGDFVFEGTTRIRRPSVYRQTAWNLLARTPSERFDGAMMRRLVSELHALTEYDSTARHPDVDRVLEHFRRGMEPAFLPPATASALLFAALEGALGRFRPPGSETGLETLVASVADRKAAAWFGQHGRQLRNDIAHGRAPQLDQQEALRALKVVVTAALAQFIRTWTAKGPQATGSPRDVFVEHLTPLPARG
jgi:hypothetical protein